MGIFSAIGAFISDIFKPAADLIDNVHTSDEERMQLRNALEDIRLKTLSKVTELEQARLKAISSVEIAESKSTHFLRANWRPMCSIAMVALIVVANFVPSIKLSEDVYKLAETFLGVYAGGRSVEKMIGKFKG